MPRRRTTTKKTTGANRGRRGRGRGRDAPTPRDSSPSPVREVPSPRASASDAPLPPPFEVEDDAPLPPPFEAEDDAPLPPPDEEEDDLYVSEIYPSMRYFTTSHERSTANNPGYDGSDHDEEPELLPNPGGVYLPPFLQQQNYPSQVSASGA